MKTQNVVILGGGYAGVNAALRLQLRNKTGNITLVNERPEFIERIRNHQAAAGQSLQVYDLASILGRRIAFVQGRANTIDAQRMQVQVTTANGLQVLPYDALVYALGSGAPVAQAKGMFNVTNRADALALEVALAKNPEQKVLVLGAGLTGLELATELREKWPKREIILIDRHEPGSHLSPKGRAYLNECLSDMGIAYKVHKFDSAASDSMADAGAIVVNCAGFLSPELAKISGLTVDEKNRLPVNDYLQAVGHPEIFVAGDAASYRFGTREIAYAGCATAMPMGTHVGEAAHAFLSGKALPRFHFGFVFQCISLGRNRGLIQFLDKRTGLASNHILTGKTGAIVKELICKMTIALPRWESKTGWPFYTWRKTRFMKRSGNLASQAA